MCLNLRHVSYHLVYFCVERPISYVENLLQKIDEILEILSQKQYLNG